MRFMERGVGILVLSWLGAGCGDAEPFAEPVASVTQALNICNETVPENHFVDGIPAYAQCATTQNSSIYSNNGIDTATTSQGSDWVRTQMGGGYQCTELAHRYLRFKWNVNWIPNGNAGTWCNATPPASSGVEKTTTPVHGDLIVFAPSACGSDAATGHVALVDVVVNATTVTIVEENGMGRRNTAQSCATCYLHVIANSGAIAAGGASNSGGAASSSVAGGASNRGGAASSSAAGGASNSGGAASSSVAGGASNRGGAASSSVANGASSSGGAASSSVANGASASHVGGLPNGGRASGTSSGGVPSGGVASVGGTSQTPSRPRATGGATMGGLGSTGGSAPGSGGQALQSGGAYASSTRASAANGGTAMASTTYVTPSAPVELDAIEADANAGACGCKVVGTASHAHGISAWIAAAMLLRLRLGWRRPRRGGHGTRQTRCVNSSLRRASRPV